MNMMDVVKPWESVNAALGLSGAIRDEVHYKALLDFVENCFNRFGTDEHCAQAMRNDEVDGICLSLIIGDHGKRTLIRHLLRWRRLFDDQQDHGSAERGQGLHARRGAYLAECKLAWSGAGDCCGQGDARSTQRGWLCR